jgi:hypothetical protein
MLGAFLWTKAGIYPDGAKNLFQNVNMKFEFRVYYWAEPNSYLRPAGRK